MPVWECDNCGNEHHIPEAVMKGCAEVKMICDECGEEQWFDFSSYAGSDGGNNPGAFGAVNMNMNMNITEEKTAEDLINHRNRNQNILGNGGI